VKEKERSLRDLEERFAQGGREKTGNDGRLEGEIDNRYWQIVIRESGNGNTETEPATSGP